MSIASSKAYTMQWSMVLDFHGHNYINFYLYGHQQNHSYSFYSSSMIRWEKLSLILCIYFWRAHLIHHQWPDMENLIISCQIESTNVKIVNKGVVVHSKKRKVGLLTFYYLHPLSIPCHKLDNPGLIWKWPPVLEMLTCKLLHQGLRFSLSHNHQGLLLK